MRKLNAVVIAGAAMMVWVIGAYLYLPDKVKRVGFQFDCWGVAQAFDSEFQGKWYWTEDPEFLKQVEDWRGDLKRYEVRAALRQLGGRIVLEYKNGRKEEFLTHSVGLTGPGSLVILDGHHMYSEHEPFSEFINQINPKDLK
jgi:hypothetical protein